MMTRFRVLRDCFVGGRYFVKDTVVDLPGDLEKSPKNFQLMDENALVVEKQSGGTTYAEMASKMPAISSDVGASPHKELDEVADELPLYISKKDRIKLGLPLED